MILPLQSCQGSSLQQLVESALAVCAGPATGRLVNVGWLQAARRVYETALASLAARPAAVGHHAALLALPFADMEASSGSKDATARALHVLAWLGAGGAFTSKAGAGAGTADAR